MFYHVVTIKWTKDVEAKAIADFCGALDLLSQESGVVEVYAHGPSAKVREDSADYGIVAGFRQAADWSKYDKHPAHARPRNLLRDLAADYVVVQFDA